MKLKIIILCIIWYVPAVCFSQRITYSEPERDDVRNVEFEIIGKFNNNYLIYKVIRTKKFICVYDNDMKLKEKIELEYLPDRVLNTDFISYPNHSYFIYQYQKRNVLYCMAVKLDSSGKKMGEPVEIDTTSIGIFSENKIYNVSFSEDKQKIMVFKIQKKGDKFHYTTLLFNSQMQMLNKDRLVLNYDDRKQVLSDFFVDNSGSLIFTQATRSGARDYFNNVMLVIKEPASDTFNFNTLNLNGRLLDEIKLKIDNVNQHYLLTSLYYTKKRGDIEGIFTYMWDKNDKKVLIENGAKFSDSLKAEAKREGSVKMAFNNFFIKNIILKKDGGYIAAAEDHYTQTRSLPFNRMDYLYGGSNYAYDNYYSSNYYNSYRRRNFGNPTQTRYYYDNIAVLSINNTGELQWSNIIHKSQYDDESDNALSFQLFNAGGELHFIFNELNRRNQILADQTLQQDGKIIRNPTLKSLDKGFEFMPQYAKQVSFKQIIVPCSYRSYICFAKIDF